MVVMHGGPMSMQYTVVNKGTRVFSDSTVGVQILNKTTGVQLTGSFPIPTLRPNETHQQNFDGENGDVGDIYDMRCSSMGETSVLQFVIDGKGIRSDANQSNNSNEVTVVCKNKEVTTSTTLKTYSNTPFAYSVQYPANWYLYEIAGGKSFIRIQSWANPDQNTIVPDYGNAISIVVSQGVSSSELESFVRGRMEKGDTVAPQKVAGINGFMITTSAGAKELYVSHKGRAIGLRTQESVQEVNHDLDAVIDQILASFALLP
jgi:hypothetical protein